MMLRSPQSLPGRFNNYQTTAYATSRNVNSTPTAIQRIKVFFRHIWYLAY